MELNAIKNELLNLLGDIVPAAEYLQAENNARETEDTHGTLSDLRVLRDRALASLLEAASDFHRLHIDVAVANGATAKVRALLTVERFPADDEQQKAA